MEIIEEGMIQYIIKRINIIMRTTVLVVHIMDMCHCVLTLYEMKIIQITYNYTNLIFYEMMAQLSVSNAKALDNQDNHVA